MRSNFNIKNIVTDSEKPLVNMIQKFFPNSQNISCYIHYIHDIVSYTKLFWLFKKENKFLSNIMKKNLSILPIIYNGDIKTIDNLFICINIYSF